MTIQEAVTLIGDLDLVGFGNNPVRWADLGCGSGLFARALARYLPKGSVIYGVDSSPSLKKEITPEGVEITAVRKDFIKDDLGLELLDGIMMANSLHYVEDKVAFLRRLRKTFGPELPFLIVEYDTDNPVARWVPYPVSLSNLTELFRSEGYSRFRKLGERPSVYHNGRIYAVQIS